MQTLAHQCADLQSSLSKLKPHARIRPHIERELKKARTRQLKREIGYRPRRRVQK